MNKDEIQQAAMEANNENIFRVVATAVQGARNG